VSARNAIAFPTSAKQTISPYEAQRALYVDFEGRKDEPPALLGAMYATGARFSDTRVVMSHYVVDPQLSRLGSAWTIDGPYRYDVRHESLSGALNAVIRLARSKNRLIVSWSQHDLGVIVQYGNLRGMLADELAARYRDGKATAKRWYRRHRAPTILRPGASGRRHTLQNYLELINFADFHPAYGTGLTGENLRVVREAIARRGDVAALTERQRERWYDVLGHNYYDCCGLRDVVMRAAHELSVE